MGRDYAWEDYHSKEIAALGDWLKSPAVSLYTLLSEGWPKGFFTLEQREDSVEIMQFGMVPEAVGRGLGSFLLKTAILTAGDIPGTRKLTLNTCTLDHPRALQTYQKHGFTAVRREDKTRTLTRDRDLSRIPD